MLNKEKIDLAKQAISELGDYTELIKVLDKTKTEYSKNELTRITDKLITSVTSLLQSIKEN